MEIAKSLGLKALLVVVGTMAVVFVFSKGDLRLSMENEANTLAAVSKTSTTSQVSAQANDPIILMAYPDVVYPGEKAVLAWVTTGMENCMSSGGWSGNRRQGGSFTTPVLTQTTSYTLGCVDALGATSSVTTNVTFSNATKFQIGDRVRTTGSVNVRQTPSTSGANLGTQREDAVGIVTQGPTTANGYIWWRVDFTTGADGWAIQSSLIKTLNQPAPTPAPTVSISATPTSIVSGTSATITWSSTNATACTASGGWSGTKAISGTESVSPTTNTTYTITCNGAGGSANQSTIVTVTAPVTPAPTITLSANPTSVTSGASSTLTWSSTNATSCTASGGWSGAKATSGTQSVSPTQTTVYVLDCTGAGGTVSQNTTVNVSAPTTTWTFCSNVGSTCNFIGLRDVRLINAAGANVVKEAYAMIPCAGYGFGSSPTNATRCEYGPMKTATLVNPMPGMGGLNPANITVPLGDSGVSTARTITTGFTGTPSGDGSFRTTCNLSKYGFFDPIVYPGQTGTSHLHMFFGNTGVNGNSTVSTIANSGNSTCRGGILNRTAYWIPGVFDSRTGEVIAPDFGTFYYKTGYNIDPTVTQPIPSGLRIIAGNKNNSSGVQYGDLLEIQNWGCSGTYRNNTGAIQSCPVGEKVRLTINFPQCWDGVNLDSADHQSHMAYPNYKNPPLRSTCPASHPVVIPAITEIFDFPVNPGADSSYWRLSSDMYSSSTPGGYSAHADWMDGWDPTTMTTIVRECLNKSKDCGVGGIGNGTELVYP